MKKAIIVCTVAIMLFGVALFFAHIHTVSNGPQQYPSPSQIKDNEKYLIDINTATADELQQIPGIGPSIAANIITYREENGPFTEYVDLLNVDGIGYKKLGDMLEYIIIK